MDRKNGGTGITGFVQPHVEKKSVSFQLLATLAILYTEYPCAYSD